MISADRPEMTLQSRSPRLSQQTQRHHCSDLIDFEHLRYLGHAERPRRSLEKIK